MLGTALKAWSNSVLCIISRSHVEALSGCLTGHQITKVYLCHGLGGLFWWGVVQESQTVADGMAFQMDFSLANMLTGFFRLPRIPVS